MKLSELLSLPGRLEGSRGIAPNGVRVVPVNPELQAASLWALPRFWGCGSPFQLSLRSRASLYGVCVLVRVPSWPPRGPSLSSWPSRGGGRGWKGEMPSEQPRAEREC